MEKTRIINSKKVIVKKCSICGNEFYIRSKPLPYRITRGVNIRPNHSKTCSKECSKKHIKNTRRLYGKKWRERKREKEINGELQKR